MQIPKQLEHWTFTHIEEILTAGACEDETFDFKERLPVSQDTEGKHRLRKTITAFANSGGGFLIYGVKDDRTLNVKDRLVGIPATADFPRQFGSFPAGCQPSVDWRPCAAPIKIPGSATVLYVFEIISTRRVGYAV